MAYHIDEEHSDIVFEVNGEKVSLKVVNSGSGSGTGGEGSNIYLITVGDTTVATNKNTFSALRILSEIQKANSQNDSRYVRKDIDNIAQGLITFLKGILIGTSGNGITAEGIATLASVLSDLISSKEFVKGTGGKGFGAYLDNLKKSYFESDYLLTRIKATIAEAVIDILTSKDITCEKLTVTKQAHFFKLIIDEIKAAGGQVVLSYADCTAEKVVRQANGNYRVYWSAKDEKTGKAILNKWQVNDQALCQTFNAAEGVSYNVSNKYYWRLVVSAGRQTIDGTVYNYIELSDTVKDGDSIPEANDEIVGLGYRGTDDEARQGAIILSAYASPDRNVKAPSIVQYKGINSFSFDGHVMNQFAANGNIIRGQLKVENGKTVETAISEGVESIVVGGRNLLSNSKPTNPITNTNYNIARFDLATVPVEGQSYTISIKGQLGSNRDSFAIYNTDGVHQQIRLYPSNQHIGVYSATFNWSNTNSAGATIEPKKIIIYQFPNGDTSVSTIEWVKLEAGNKPSDWTPAPEDVDTRITTVETNFEIREGQISSKVAQTQTYAQNAAGSASTASAKAADAAGSANAAADSASQAAAKLITITQKETSINQTSEQITLQASQVTTSVQNASNAATNATNAATLATAMSKGKMLYRDPTFTSGNNNVSTYAGISSIIRQTNISDNPNGSSAYCLKLTFGASNNTNKGGFTFYTQSRANAVFVVRFVGLFPTHAIIDSRSNPTGSGAVRYWLTDNKGTGKYEEYAFYIKCGSEGTFSTTAYFTIQSSYTSEFCGRICYATVFDMTDVDDVPLRSEMASELSILSDRITSKVSQTDYDNNNNVINSRFSQIEQTANGITSRVSSVEGDLQDALADAAAKYTLKTVFNSQIQQLSDQINLRVTATTFNALGQRVSAAESLISQQANEISLRVTSAEVQEALNVVNVDGRNYFALTATALTSGNFIRRKFKLEKNTIYKVRTTIPRNSSNNQDVWAVGGQSITESSANNGVSSDAPREITSDTSGYITVSYRNTMDNAIRNGSKKIWVAKGDAIWRPALEDQDYYAQIHADNAQSAAAAQAQTYAQQAQTNAIAQAEEKYNSIFIGGRNMLSNSDVPKSGTSYQLAQYTLATIPIEGQTYTISIKGQLGNDRTHWGVYNSGGYVLGLGITPANLVNGVYVRTFTWTNTRGDTTVTPSYISIYQMQNSGTSQSTIEWVKLEAGNKPSDWTPAPEDIGSRIQDLGDEVALTVPYVVYDGDIARIKVCGIDIKAGKIAMVGDITANGNVHINADGTIKAVNADISGKITASSGTIGGWTIQNGKLSSAALSGGEIRAGDDSGKFVTINPSNGIAMVSVRADNMRGINVYTHGTSGVGIFLTAQTGATSIDSHGSVSLIARPGESILLNGLRVNTKKVTAAYTVLSSDDFLIFQTTSDVSVSMISATTYDGKMLFLKNIGSKTVTLTGGTFMAANDTGVSSSFALNNTRSWMLLASQGKWIIFAANT